MIKPALTIIKKFNKNKSSNKAADLSDRLGI